MSDEPKPDEPKPDEAQSDEPMQRDVGTAFRMRLQNDVLPRLADPKNERSAMAVKIMSIVDRQLGQGDPEAHREWEVLRESVKGQPEKVAMVENLQAAVAQYEEKLRKQIAAGADEAKVRRTAAGLINMAVMAKIKDPPKGHEEGQAEKADPPEPSKTEG